MTHPGKADQARLMNAKAASPKDKSYTSNWIYMGFAALGSWIGAFAPMTFLHRTPGHPPPPLASMAE